MHKALKIEHRNVVLATLVALLVALLWWFDPSRSGVPLCAFHTLTGWDCPGCGATRATHELLHGHVAAALRYNALWIASLPLVVYVTASELRVSAGGRPLPGDLLRQRWFWCSAMLVAMAFSVVRNLS
jgi:hypothetical protein